MGVTTQRSEFNKTVGDYRITCVDYLWTSAGNPEGTIHPEAGIRNLKTEEFQLCQHNMPHARAVAMIANCLAHGVNAYETANHVQTVGNRYYDSRWGGDDDEDQDWKRVERRKAECVDYLWTSAGNPEGYSGRRGRF